MKSQSKRQRKPLHEDDPEGYNLVMKMASLIMLYTMSDADPVEMKDVVLSSGELQTYIAAVAEKGGYLPAQVGDQMYNMVSKNWQRILCLQVGATGSIG